MPKMLLTAFLLTSISSVASAAEPLAQQLAKEPLSNLAEAAKQHGDAGRGAVLFFQPFLGCAKCHDAETGTQLGPDLSQAGKDATAEHLVESILAPSKVLKKGYETVVVLTSDERTIAGLLAAETVETLTLVDPAANGKRLVIRKSDIDKRTVSKQSLMPEGLMNTLSDRQQFLDLAKYVLEVAEGGPARAKELRPAVTALVIPEYEKQIDHAGLIRSWDAKSLRRGEAIYTRVCANCHGTKEQTGSLPTSPRFATHAFKNGSDPYSLYQTLTRGYGQMAPQPWMVPRQKYDVIHYLREVYLKPHNPSQHVKTDDAYLGKLPKGNSFGPAAANVEPWVAMDYGPSLMNTFEVGGPGPNFAYKGIAVRLDSGPGGISRGHRWSLFDTDTLRLAAAWTGAGFIDWKGIHFNGQHQIYPKLAGSIQAANPVGPGWANPATGLFQDPRFLGRDKRPYGPLPRDWARYRGLYHFGDQTVIAYRVGDAAILELEGTESNPNDPTKIAFTRTLEIGKSSRDLAMRVAPIGIAAAIRSDKPMSLVESDGFTVLRIPAARTPLRLKLLMMKGTATDLKAFMTSPLPRPLEPLTHGGPKRWPERLKMPVAIGLPRHGFDSSQPPTRHLAALDGDLPHKGGGVKPSIASPLVGEVVASRSEATGGGYHSPLNPAKKSSSLDDGPFAVDTFALPERNPWNAQLRLTGFDFFPDGDRMAVCSWDGDVWLVSGLHRLADGLTWQRIASGLFQPLGLKIRDGAIFVCCRDQIAKLHDLNGDGETDFYECFNNDHQVTEHFHEFAMGLQTDAEGNFYYAKSGRHALPALVPHHGTLLKVSRDGSRTEILATGFRAANGVCLNPGGTFFVTDQEGFWTPKNRINLVENGGFYGNLWGFTDITDTSDSAMKPPLCWITNEFDRSPAELLWVTSDKWGPLRGSLLNISYGHGKIYVVPHEKVNGQAQGGVCALPLPPFPTGIMRGRFHPKDGQLYTCGMFAWAGNRTQPGGFYRVRYTGKPADVPISLKATATGVEIAFTDPLDPASVADVKNYSIKVWGLKRSQNYGSKHIDEHAIPVAKAVLAADGKTVRLDIPALGPTWGMAIEYRLKGSDGRAIVGTIHNTIHTLGN